MFRRITTIVLCTAAVTACTDDSAPSVVAPSASIDASTASPIFQQYVAMGTSITMGTQSDGTLAASQKQSWATQLSRRGGRSLTLPLITGFGCRAPFKAPLSSGLRISGEPVTTPTANLLCGRLDEGITLPTRNVAIAGATTQDALRTTPQTQPDPFYRKLYALVLPPNTTQLVAMRQQNPKLVSVEFGANEVLPAVSGVAIPGATIVPFTVWAPLYNALVDSVDMIANKGLLVGLIHDVATFPGMRNGNEIWSDRAMLLAAFNVAVSSDCNASANLSFVPVRVPTAVAIGLANRSQGLPPYPFSCADLGFGIADYVLTPSEAAIVNSAMAQMNAEVINVAVQRGFAHFELEALYGRPDLKPIFSSVSLMTSNQPYGPFISLDGIHPNAAGHSILTDAAVQALNATYNLGIPGASSFIASR
ncbi:MAG: hypothetical protein ABI877_03525 [Gemmatimonadaceae bacterium]